MRLKLRLAALAVAAFSAVLWFFGGPNLGWTKTSVTHTKVDPVTEIEFPVTEKRFVPGVDFLAACFAAAGGLCAVSLLIRPTPAVCGKTGSEHLSVHRS